MGKKEKNRFTDSSLTSWDFELHHPGSLDLAVAQLAADGIKKIAVVTPGFSVDNLETLEEIAIRGRETFIAGGGEYFVAVPCLNASDAGVAMLRILLARELEGWVSPH